MQAFFFTRLVCEMIATGTYWFFFNGRGCCDHNILHDRKGTNKTMIDNTLHDRKGTNKTMIDKTTEWVREWLLFNVNLSAISWWEQVGWNDVEMMNADLFRVHQTFFFTRLVCEMIATGTYWFFFNGRGCCDHKWVKRFVRLMYTKQISIHHFNIISSNLLSPRYSWQINILHDRKGTNKTMIDNILHDRKGTNKTDW
jgi:hypothetical protein